MAPAPFVPGLQLSEALYREGVAPILAAEFPAVRYAAARLGGGSEVLGFDTALSMDHDWGPLLQLFLNQDDFALREAIHEALRQRLPQHIEGFPTHFSPPNEEGTRFMVAKDNPVDHRVEIMTVAGFLIDYMAYDPREEPTVREWLVWPQQLLLGLTGGAVFRDDRGDLTSVRRRLAYYPHDVWLLLLAAQWRRIAQEEPFVGRSGDVGDELGSTLIAARLVHDIMLMCFLMEKVYAPYPKWFGTAFRRLQCAPVLTPLLQQVLAARSWEERQARLAEVLERIAAMHNSLGITAPLETHARLFYDRPYRVIAAGRFVEAIRQAIVDPAIADLRADIGSIDQFSHSTDLRSYPDLHKRLQTLYK